MIQRKGEVADSTVYFGKSFAAVGRTTTLMDSVLGGGGDKAKTAIAISQPSEFRQAWLTDGCLALRASRLWLRYATLQNLIPSFP